MKDKIMFSVCVITYNQESYISKTLDSILSQNHDYSYEIVIGDDCSTDNTRKIISDYEKKYPEVIKPLYNSENLGIIKNYFNVLLHCSGKYIMECAGDDFWLPEKVNTQILYMENNPEVGMCYGNARIMDSESEVYTKDSIGNDRCNFNQLMLGNCVPALTVCFRNELLKNYIKDVSPIDRGWMMEDIPMWLWFAKNSYISYIKKNFGVYRVFDNSASHSTNMEKQKRFNDSCLEVRRFFAMKYDCNDLLLQYENLDNFQTAIMSNDRENMLKYYDENYCYNLSKKLKLKILIARNKILYKILFGGK